MVQYRDDPLPFPLPPEGELPPELTPSPGEPTPEPAEPDIPDFPQGAGAGGDFDSPDYPEEPDPDFDDDYDGPDDYYGPDEQSGPEPDRAGNGFARQTACSRARQALQDAYDQMESEIWWIAHRRERIQEYRIRLVNCGSEYWVRFRGMPVEDCERIWNREIRILEQEIENRRVHLRQLHTRILMLKQQVRESCPGG